MLLLNRELFCVSYCFYLFYFNYQKSIVKSNFSSFFWVKFFWVCLAFCSFYLSANVTQKMADGVSA
jgi:hypothetical protein